MYILIALFYISLLGIAGMILLKRREVKTGKPSVLSRLGRGSDHIFHAVFDAIHRTLSSINRHTFIAVGHWIAFHVLLRTRKIYVEIKDRALKNPHGKKVIDAVRGRGQITDHGASFYLRSLSEGTDEDKK